MMNDEWIFLPASEMMSFIGQPNETQKQKKERRTDQGKLELIYCHVDVVQAKILGPTVDGTEIHRTGVHFMTGIVESIHPSLHTYCGMNDDCLTD